MMRMYVCIEPEPGEYPSKYEANSQGQAMKRDRVCMYINEIVCMLCIFSPLINLNDVICCMLLYLISTMCNYLLKLSNLIMFCLVNRY